MKATDILENASQQPSTSEPTIKPHDHYFKDVSNLNEIDVYRVCELFGVDDPSGATHHAIKKLLCAGKRGAKDRKKDVQEAIDTLTRRVAMWEEVERAKRNSSAANGVYPEVVKPESPEKLKAGQVWKDRRGKDVTIVDNEEGFLFSAHNGWPFKEMNGNRTYRDDGTYDEVVGKESFDDLITLIRDTEEPQP